MEIEGGVDRSRKDGRGNARANNDRKTERLKVARGQEFF